MDIDKIFDDIVERQNRNKWSKLTNEKYPKDISERDYFASVLSNADKICKKLEFEQKKSSGEMSDEEIAFMKKIPHWLID